MNNKGKQCRDKKNSTLSEQDEMSEDGTQPFKQKLEYLQLFASSICIFNEFFHSDVIDL